MLKQVKTAVVVAACAIALGATAQSCAKVHHVATVTVLTSHSAIAAVQDTADAVTCGSITAPTPCLPVEVRHGVVSEKLKEALRTDIAVLTAVRQWPGPPAPLDVAADLAKIQALLSDVVRTLPDGAAKSRLLALLGGVK